MREPARRARRYLAFPLVAACVMPALATGVGPAAAGAATSSTVADAPGSPAGQAAPAKARRAPAALPVGRRDLPESRRSRTIAPGVNWTTIRRGSTPAEPANIATTDGGPWTVNVVSIDPRTATGRLAVSAGATLAGTTRTSTLARSAKAVAAVNGGFFAFTRSTTAPGDPIGLSVLNGTLVSEPLRGSASTAMLVDARTKRLNISTFTWSASLRSVAAPAANQARLTVSGVNREPAAIWACEQVPQEESGEVPDPAQPNSTPTPPANNANPPPLPDCQGPGEIIRFTGHWGPRTPSGAGAEVILNRHGCVLRTRTARGGPLSPAHTSYQATGQAATALLRMAGAGCMRFEQQLLDSARRPVKLTATTNAVNGRQILVRDGALVEDRSGPGFAGRHPRTIAGRTARGVVALITIDGRRTTSVGVTLAEAARIARSVGLVDAINLDGGGSTTMVVRGAIVNQVSGRSERAVGDALVYLSN